MDIETLKDRFTALLGADGVVSAAADLEPFLEDRRGLHCGQAPLALLPRTTQEYTYPIESHSLLTMFSDGLATKTGISPYTGLQGRHPALIAGLLYRDFTRRRDDATVLVARMEG